MIEIRRPSVPEIKRAVGRVATVARAVGEITLIAAAPSVPIAITQLLNPHTAEAAGPVCDPKKNTNEYTIVIRRAPNFDLGGKVGSFDKGIDPWLELPVTGGGIKAIERSTGKVLAENNYTLQKPNVPVSLFKPKEGEQNVAWSLLKWQGNCDVDTTRPTPNGGQRTIAGKEIIIVTTQDETNQTFLKTAAAGGVDSIWTGRKYKTAEQFLAVHDQKPALARDLTPQTLQKIRDEVKRAISQTEDQKRLAIVEGQLKTLQDSQVNKTSGATGSEGKVADIEPQSSAQPNNSFDLLTLPIDWRLVVAALLGGGLVALALGRRRRQPGVAEIAVPGQVVRVHANVTPPPPIDIDINIKPGTVDIKKRQGSKS